MILLEYRLREDLDKEVVRSSISKALEIFPLNKVKLGLDPSDNKLVYEYNDVEPDVYEYDGKPHFLGSRAMGICSAFTTMRKG